MQSRKLILTITNSVKSTSDCMAADQGFALSINIVTVSLQVTANIQIKELFLVTEYCNSVITEYCNLQATTWIQI